MLPYINLLFSPWTKWVGRTHGSPQEDFSTVGPVLALTLFLIFNPCNTFNPMLIF